MKTDSISKGQTEVKNIHYRDMNNLIETKKHEERVWYMSKREKSRSDRDFMAMMKYLNKPI